MRRKMKEEKERRGGKGKGVRVVQKRSKEMERTVKETEQSMCREYIF